MEEGSLVSVSYAVLSHLNFHHFSISADQICSSLGMQICCFSSCLPREQKSPKSFPAGLKNMPLVSEGVCSTLLKVTALAQVSGLGFGDIPITPAKELLVVLSIHSVMHNQRCLHAYKTRQLKVIFRHMPVLFWQTSITKLT